MQGLRADSGPREGRQAAEVTGTAWCEGTGSRGACGGRRAGSPASSVPEAWGRVAMHISPVFKSCWKYGLYLAI